MEIIIVWVILAVLVGVFADSRGRSGFGFFLLSALLSPLLGFIIVLVIRNLAEETRREEESRRAQERKDFDQKREHEKQIEALRAITAPARAPTIDAAAGKQLTSAEEIEKLGALLERGLLSTEEFQQQKAAVLKRQH